VWRKCPLMTQSGHRVRDAGISFRPVTTKQHRQEICGIPPRTHRLPFSDGNIAASGTAMKKLATAIAAIALIGTPAFAAAVKAPPPAPAPVYNWTGWYAGVNAGACFGNVKTDSNVAPVSFQVPPGGPFIPFTSDIAGADRAHPSGFRVAVKSAITGSTRP
jgi:hypothetical protein